MCVCEVCICECVAVCGVYLCVCPCVCGVVCVLLVVDAIL